MTGLYFTLARLLDKQVRLDNRYIRMKLNLVGTRGITGDTGGGNEDVEHEAGTSLEGLLVGWLKSDDRVEVVQGQRSLCDRVEGERTL